MTMVLPDISELTASVPDGAAPSPTPFGDAGFLRRFRTQPVAVAGLVILVLVTLTAILAPLIAPFDPNASDLSQVLKAPSTTHLLGTDQLGRDLLSRVIYAARLSLLAAVEAVVIAVVIGVPLGVLAGYFRGPFDAIVMRFTDALMSIPALVLAITIAGVLGPNLTHAMIAIGIVYVPRFIRVARGAALDVSQEVYIDSARATGCSPMRIAWRHVAPNVLSPLIVQTSLSLGAAVIAEASLSFLGLGVQPPEASLGLMLKLGFDYMNVRILLILAPGVVIVLMVLAFNWIGDGLRDSIGLGSGPQR
jgi:peptide/nickel transport system permease protein